jgi:hypothetical protein
MSVDGSMERAGHVGCKSVFARNSLILESWSEGDIDRGERLQLRLLEGCQVRLNLSLSLGRFTSCRLGASSSSSSLYVFVPPSPIKKTYCPGLNF